jgi:hypothetical protein
MIPSVLPTGRRLWTSVAGAVVLSAVTADQAHACWSHCVAHYGAITQTAPGVFRELVSCTQSETREGPVYITCFYKEYDFATVSE